ncbi:MAG TPA: GntR family transcriptional regulator [Mycobacterium sp.]|nr:GntR family transcriptional regulator [Mycobacterium sp.]
MPHDTSPLPALDPNDQRVLFQRIVDDILTKIEQGELYPGAPLPSARKMADLYGVGLMTVQRALRELQQMRVTFSVAGKGTFVHPELADNSDQAALREAIADPDLLRRIGDYLAAQADILARHHNATDAKTRNAAGRDLLALATGNRDLIDEITQHVPDTQPPTAR